MDGIRSWHQLVLDNEDKYSRSRKQWNCLMTLKLIDYEADALTTARHSPFRMQTLHYRFKLENKPRPNIL